MEDVQDGIKVSIQDGVEEDPKTIITGKSFLGLISMSKQIVNPQLTTVLSTTTDSTDKTASIATVMATAVT